MGILVAVERHKEVLLMVKGRHYTILEKQQTAGAVQVSTVFFSMEEELREFASILEDGAVIRDARTREHVVRIIRKAANFCGMHGFQHLNDAPVSLEAP